MVFTVKLLMFILYSFILYGCPMSGASISGPFRSYVSSVTKCNKTSYPQHPNPSVTLDIDVYNGTDGFGLRGCLVVLNYTTDVKFKTKSLIWEKGKWKTNFMVVDNGCRGSLMPFWMAMIKAKFDKEKCAFLPCRAPFQLMNTNKLHHLMTKTAEYGKVMFVSEMVNMGKQYRTLYCHEYVGVIEPV